MHPIISFTFLFCVADALSPVHFAETVEAKNPLQPLCDLGCQCPPEGQNMIFLDCENRRISKLPNLLQFSSPMTKTSFQGNRIAKLNIDTFTLADSVQELDFSLNQITDIDDYALFPFKSLAVLHLSNNRLSHVEAGLLEGLQNLRILELGHNNIQELSHLAFQSVPNLQELRIHHNPIFKLEEDVFRFLPKLEKLDLQETGLVSLPDGLFKNTPKLHWLSLSNNAFEFVPEKALGEAASIDSLDLSGNDFNILHRGDFKRLSNLSLLHLNNLQRLKTVEKDAFVGLKSLKTLSCSYNPKLTSIDREAFGNMTYDAPPKEQLFLRKNALRTLTPLETESLTHLSFVDLGDNPWKCDCQLQWMMDLKPETQMNIVCESPPHLRGRSLSSMQPDDLQCEEVWHFTTFVLVLSSMVTFGVVLLATSAIVCSRTPLGLYIRAKYQFSYAKVAPKTEVVDLEWDPTADV